MKLGVYAIAKNEAKHVKRWLDATEDADFRLVADTGSTDDTVKLLNLESRKNRKPIIVVQLSIEPFRFDDARNAALLACPADADMLLSLDMDEVPEPGFFDAVRAAWSPDVTRMWHWMDTGYRWRMNRLHARHGYRWVSPCHEVVVPYGGTVEHAVLIESVINHQPDNTKSRGQYLPLLEMAVKEAPHDARMWTYLAREYSYVKDWPAVFRTVEKALQWDGTPHERGYLCRLAAQDAEQSGTDVLPWLKLATSEAPDELESWHALALQHHNDKNWQGVFDAAKKVLTAERKDHYLTEAEVYEWRMWDLLAVFAYHVGELEMAADAAALAVAARPDDPRLTENLGFMEHALRRALEGP